MSTATTDTQVTVQGKLIDVAPLLPLKMVHWRRLRAIDVDPVQIGQNLNRNGQMSGEVLQKLAYYTIRLVDPSLSDAILDEELTLPQTLGIATSVMNHEGATAKEGPTSTPYSSSPSDGNGVHSTLNS